MKSQKEFFTTHEIAKQLFVTPPTVIQWIKSKKLTALKTVGGHRRITRSELERFKREFNYVLEKDRDARKRILIIDDEKSIQIGLKKLFEKEGFDVEAASDGFEAGTKLYQKIPHLVILDLIMPYIDGFKTCKYLKDNHEFSAIKIIVLTGYPSEDHRKRVIELGADVVLAKPIENSVLLEEVKRLLQKNSSSPTEAHNEELPALT